MDLPLLLVQYIQGIDDDLDVPITAYDRERHASVPIKHIDGVKMDLTGGVV